MANIYEETKQIKAKWKPLIESAEFGAPIKDQTRKNVTARLLENTERAYKEDAANGQAPMRLHEDGNYTTGVDNVDPILINLVRRTAPNLMAYDVVGVQPMNMPTGLIFCLRALLTGTQPQGPFGVPGDSRPGFNQGGALDSHGETLAQEWSDNTNGGIGVSGDPSLATTNKFGGSLSPNEAFYNEAPTNFSGTGSQTANTSANYGLNAYSVGTGMATTVGETLGRGLSGDADFQEMTFTIDKKNVVAGLRALKAMYTFELQQDLRAVHGLDAEKLLADILSTEILSETNREIINRIRQCAKIAQSEVEYANGTPVLDSSSNVVRSLAGSFDVSINSDGRWQAEKYKSLLMKIAKEANAIAKDTRRGKGNFVICSSDVAAALDLSGKLIYSPAVDNSLNVDDTGNTFVGVLQGRYKVYIDPYLGYDEIIVGYKGPNQMDAGMFYCPYVPLQMFKALGEKDFQPKMAFKTRYGIVSNPFTNIKSNGNAYYRKFKVTGL